MLDLDNTWKVNSPPAKHSYINFHPLEVVSRYRDPQLQVGENVFNLIANIYNSSWLNSHIIHNNLITVI